LPSQAQKNHRAYGVHPIITDNFGTSLSSLSDKTSEISCPLLFSSSIKSSQLHNSDFILTTSPLSPFLVLQADLENIAIMVEADAKKSFMGMPVSSLSIHMETTDNIVFIDVDAL
jgi:hypothetical protein